MSVAKMAMFNLIEMITWENFIKSKLKRNRGFATKFGQQSCGFDRGNAIKEQQLQQPGS